MRNLLVISISLLSFGLWGQNNSFDTSKLSSINRRLDSIKKSFYPQILTKINNQSLLIKRDSANADAYLSRASLKFQMQDYNGAMPDLNKVIELNPKDALAYNIRGLCKSELGDKVGACLDWKKAVKLGDETAKDKISKYCK